MYRLEMAGHGPIAWRETQKDDLPIEVTQYVIPSDRVEQVVVLERDGSAEWPWPDESGEDT